jgi:hypothetical protein
VRGYGIVSVMAMATPDLDSLNEQQLRDLARQLMADSEAQMARKDRLIHLKDTTIAQLKHEIAVLRRFRFGKKKANRSRVYKVACWKKQLRPTLPRSKKSLNS